MTILDVNIRDHMPAKHLNIDHHDTKIIKCTHNKVLSVSENTAFWNSFSCDNLTSIGRKDHQRKKIRQGSIKNYEKRAINEL